MSDRKPVKSISAASHLIHCHLWTGFCLHSCLVGKNHTAVQAQSEKVQIVSKGTEFIFSARLTVNLDFPREHASKNDHCAPLLENDPKLGYALPKLNPSPGDTVPQVQGRINVCDSDPHGPSLSGLLRWWASGLQEQERPPTIKSLKGSKLHSHDKPKPIVRLYSKPLSPQNLWL